MIKNEIGFNWKFSEFLQKYARFSRNRNPIEVAIVSRREMDLLRNPYSRPTLPGPDIFTGPDNAGKN